MWTAQKESEPVGEEAAEEDIEVVTERRDGHLILSPRSKRITEILTELIQNDIMM